MEAGIIIFCLILSAFFSGMEIAFVSSNKIYLEIEKKQDGFLSQILTKLTQKPSKFIAAMLVGHNIALVLYGYFMGEVILQWIAAIGYSFGSISEIFLQTVLATIIILITSEFLPKVFFQIYANTLIKVLAVPAYLFYVVFYYISSLIMWLSDIILKRFFQTGSDPVQLFFSKVELGNYINEQMSSFEDHEEVDSEIQIFQNALEFSNVKARDIMTPRTELSAVEISANIVELRNVFIETGYSKILIYRESFDDIIGYVHSFELFKEPSDIMSILISVEFVPETIYIKDVLNLLTKKRKSVAVVLDEYGGTSGIVTTEDIVEELFGENEDEHDSDEEFVEQELEEGSYLFSTRFDVTYLNDKYKFDIPESDSYGTLGGFILDSAKNIPNKGDEITIDSFHFKIEKATGSKIEMVKMTVVQ